MKNVILDSVNSELIRDWYESLSREGEGCCYLPFAADDEYEYSVCMGWHDLGGHNWTIAWKIGRQTHNTCMQTDLDIDFEMPYNEDGDVDDTLHALEREPSDWAAVAESMKDVAARIEREWVCC